MRKRKAKRKYYWYKDYKWSEFFQNLLLSVARKRYRLIISDIVELGATSCQKKTVEVNPIFMICPRKKAQRKQIRNCPSNRDKFEQLMTTALIYHEAAHIRFSGNKPQEKLLGWLWNALEDRRIERLLTQAYPHFQSSLEFLNDTVWYYTEKTEDILSGCLLWGWEHHLPTNQRKFQPTSEQFELWEQKIKPLVEQAWVASHSDEVTIIATKILHLLGINNFEQELNQLPFWFWQAPEGDQTDDESITEQELQDLDIYLSDFLGTINTNLLINNDDSSSTENNIKSENNTTSNSQELSKFNEDDDFIDDLIDLIDDEDNWNDNYLQSQLQEPHCILARVEGYARDLATALKPLVPKTIKRPHRARGELNLERALDGHQRPFDYKQAPAPARSVAILTLIDQSGSMDGQRINEARAATMLLDRASEIAGITYGVYGFEKVTQPIIHRSLNKENHSLSREKIAGIRVGGSTYLTPVFKQAANDLLARSEQIKILIIFHDGELCDYDAVQVKQQVEKLSKIERFFLQPIFIGNDLKAIKNNQKIFGHVLHCAQVEELNQLLRVWLRALLK